MATSIPAKAVERPSSGPLYASDEEAVARWAAWFEALPEDLRDALDERGRGAMDLEERDVTEIPSE
jgi:hypothetical protein